MRTKYHPEALRLLSEEELEKFEKEGKIKRVKRGDEVIIVAAVAGG